MARQIQSVLTVTTSSYTSAAYRVPSTGSPLLTSTNYSRHYDCTHPSASSPTNHKVLILCMWMGAPPKLVNKYTNHYLDLFPRYIITLMTCTMPEMFFISSSTHSRLLQPALDVLLKHRNQNQNSTPETEVVAAVYSDGGAYSLVQLARLYQSSTGQPLPIRSAVFDSCPGSADLKPAIHAMYSTFPPSLTKSPLFVYPLWMLIWLTLRIYKLVFTLLGMVDPITAIRNALLDPTLFKVNDTACAAGTTTTSKGTWVKTTTFIYSQEDRSVPYKAVERFVNQAEEKGWTVKKERFEGSQHVAHANLDKDRYWRLVANALGDKPH
ncbi:uncharacterized protein I303_104532 [Kwoniella dejecticola CBS 10117]|uniref:Indole-diterpene biosynthesis protein PaxU n=1 Tax=Kwoniella dejecticola CBS 10117 TaxID=1296121 RepID=A0A1A6A513_9TREE|nr:uncharacterized protein I303_04491 [Kwoniella dejecticola CBS 10117]OBR85159.1 hypothetical protein I303_04491 [Kwoniella dejecticola CBS 10117]